MTTLIDIDFLRVFEMVSDLNALEVTQRIIQGEVTFHEARVVQLKEMNKALGGRIEKLRKG
jgi:hypothetical protein